ncbi:Ribosomal RNA small subunit methyltransferase J [compost metagenome]
MLVTTSYAPTQGNLLKAAQLATELQGKLVARGKESLAGLREQFNEDCVLLVTKDEIRYYVEEQPPIFFHPSMGAVRVKRWLRGEVDLLVQACQVVEGDSVVDCTAGLASDSLVLSCAVGVQGCVIALESEAIPAMLIREGLAAYDSDIPEMTEAMRRIQVVHLDHFSYLRGLADQSVDVVYFDPMFRRPIEESNSISPLRQVANGNAITAETMHEARRVARKTIVLKEHKKSSEFARLGFTNVLRSNTKITYGVIQL